MNKKQTDNFGIRYEKSEIQYATQFLISPGREEVLIDLSSGLIAESNDEKTLPIQTRLALPWSTIERLSAVLNKVVAARKNEAQITSAKSANTTAVPKATLPTMDGSTLPNAVDCHSS